MCEGEVRKRWLAWSLGWLRMKFRWTLINFKVFLEIFKIFSKFLWIFLILNFGVAEKKPNFLGFSSISLQNSLNSPINSLSFSHSLNSLFRSYVPNQSNITLPSSTPKPWITHTNIFKSITINQNQTEIQNLIS